MASTTKTSKGRIIVTGMIGYYAEMIGVTAHYIQFVIALEKAGYDVFYFEDEQPEYLPYDPASKNSAANVGHLKGSMEFAGMENRWSYLSRINEPAFFGLDETKRREIFDTADAIVSVGGLTPMKGDYLRVPRRVFLDTDPGRVQIKAANGDKIIEDHLKGYTHHYTFAENTGKPGCIIPTVGFEWRPARQPIIPFAFWDEEPAQPWRRERYTTILNWGRRGRGKDLMYQGKLYQWGKGAEWAPIMNLPTIVTKDKFELAALIHKEDQDAREALLQNGWALVEAGETTKNLDSWKNYLLNSKGEFTAAKHIYVQTRGGWFSERSASYLAAGRPVITQDTGFSNFLPTGEGLFAWDSVDDILSALDAIRGDPARHDRAAKEIAHEHFDGPACVEALLRD